MQDSIKLSLHEEIVLAFQTYVKEAEMLERKGVKASAARARKALQDLNKLTTQRRKEIQEIKSEI